LTEVAAAAALPWFFTVVARVRASVSTGLAGATVVPVTVRSGLGAGTPTTWNSATWPALEPVLPVIFSWTSATRAVTGMVTVLPEAGSKAYGFAATSVVKVELLCSRPSTSTVWVRAPQAAAGLSLSTTCWVSAFEPSATVRVLG
jgi:hypothetical protein